MNFVSIKYQFSNKMAFLAILLCLLFSFVNNSYSVKERETPDVVKSDFQAVNTVARIPDSVIFKLMGILEHIIATDYDLLSILKAYEMVVTEYIRESQDEKVFGNNEQNIAQRDAEEKVLLEGYYQLKKTYFDTGLPWIRVDHLQEIAKMNITEAQQAVLYYAIGECVRALNRKEYEKKLNAEYYYRKCEELCRRYDDPAMLKFSLWGISQLYFDALNIYKYKERTVTEGYRDSIEQSLNLLAEIQSIDTTFVLAYYAMGAGYAILKRFDEAAFYTDKAIYLCREDDNFESVSLNIRAILAICMSDYDKGMRMGWSAYRTAEETGMEKEMRDAAEIVYFACQYIGADKVAMDALELLVKHKEILQTQDYDLMLLSHQAKYENKMQEQDLMFVKEKNLSYRKIILLATIFLNIVVALLVLISREHHRTKRAYKALVLKSQRWAKAEALPISKIEEMADKTDDLETRFAGEILKSFDRLIRDEKIYTNPNLNLNMVADDLETNRTYISAVINRYTGKNFKQYINEYRVREAIHLMSDPVNDNITLEAIGQMAGFNSRAAFYRSFAETTKLTPSQFRHNNTQNTQVN